jgi:biopolymer transport protein ExbB
MAVRQERSGHRKPTPVDSKQVALELSSQVCPRFESVIGKSMAFYSAQKIIATGLCCCLLIASHSKVVAQEQLDRPIITQDELEDLVQSNVEVGQWQGDSLKPALGGMSFLRLLMAGGMLMIPIAFMSLLVLALSLDRLLALRSSRVFPRRLRRELRRVSVEQAAVSPTELFRMADLFPSAAARVLKDLLGKVGRPIPEAESTIHDSVQREADRLHGNVRWLTLAAAVTPLLGLLGTVWGMIIAFYNTTQLTSGTNRAEYLAEGIYVALVTTLAGLAVAIPAAIFAHYFEGRITKSLTLVDVELRRLLPQLEQYEGRTRFCISPTGISERTIASQPFAAGDKLGSVDPSEHPSPVKAPKLRM